MSSVPAGKRRGRRRYPGLTLAAGEQRTRPAPRPVSSAPRPGRAWTPRDAVRELIRRHAGDGGALRAAAASYERDAARLRAAALEDDARVFHRIAHDLRLAARGEV